MTARGKALKYILTGFVAVSALAAVYKAVGPACCGGAAAQPEETAAPAALPAQARPPAPAPAGKPPAAVNTAVVYYFYTDTRCTSCTTIEAYTREAVEDKLAAGYKGWRVEFRGVNIDEKHNDHFIRDYWLSSKAVIVQKFSGDKALNWAKLDRVWTLIGDKEAFMSYVVSETYKLLDEK